MTKTSRLCALVVGLLAISSARAAEKQAFDLTITGTKQDLTGLIVTVPVSLHGDTKPDGVLVQDASGNTYAAQATAPGLLSHHAVAGGTVARELHIVVPFLKANGVLKLRASFPSAVPAAGKSFAWHTQDGVTDLTFSDRPVLRYMHKPYDESTKEQRELTYKVYHHLFDPTGKRLVTKGPGGLYPHHRGIFFGYKDINYGNGKKADTWHCTGGTHQSHEKFLASEAGSLLGRHLVEIAWHGQDKEVFARESRELTVYHLPGGTLVDFASRLQTAGGPIKLDGDPQHAGVQFRADNEVASRMKETIFIRPDGVGQPGVEWNWPQQKNQVNLPWKAMSFMLGSQRYTVADLDRPENPKEARFSERTYGRFGSYFVYELTPKNPLEVRNRFWLQEGQMTPADVARLAASFTDHPQVTVK